MKQDIGAIISQARQNRKMTQEEFAARLGVTPQAVSKWERGLGVPDLALVEGICRILQIDANVLLGIKEDNGKEPYSAVMEQEVGRGLFADPLVVEFACDFIPYIVEGLKTDLIRKKRIKLARETGCLFPVTNFRDNVDLAPGEVRILSYDRALWQGVCESLDENTYEWILDQAMEVCRIHYGEILNKQIVKQLLDHLEQQYPGLTVELIPERISYLQVKEKLVKELEEKGNLRDMIHILETMESELEKKGKV